MKYFKSILFTACIITLTACNNQAANVKELKTQIDSVSYALGMNMANQTKANFEEINEAVYMQGFRNGLDSTNLLLAQKDAGQVINDFFRKRQMEKQQQMQEEAMKKAEAEFGTVKKEGEDFLAENKDKEGVKTTESGLQYTILKEGTGAKPKATDKVKVHYHGTLLDGTVFDSSVDRGEPYETFANQVIKGWTEGLQLMSVGSKYRFYIPQELGYGAFPRRGGKIRPFDALIFDVELLEIVK